MNRRTLKRLPALEGARCHGPVLGVPGVFRPLTSEALGLQHSTEYTVVVHSTADGFHY